MPGDFGIVYPLWNHTRHEGNLLDRVVGEVGLDHLTVPVVTGEMTQFRLAPGFDAPYFHTEGGWHFPAQSKLYAASGVRPRAAKWFTTRDVLAEVKEVAQKLGLKLILRIDLPSVHGLVDQSPQLRRRDAWGTELVSLPPCPSSPEFRELLRAICEDLTRYEPDGLQIENPSPRAREALRSDAGLLTWRGAAVPWATCFCAACRQVAARAGVSVDGAVRSVRAATMALRESRDAPVGDPSSSADHSAEVEFDSAVAKDAAAWLEDLGDAERIRRFFLILNVGTTGADFFAEPILHGRWANLLRGMALFVPDVLSPAVLRRFADGSVQGLSLPAWSLFNADANRLVRFVSDVASAGDRFFDFERLEESPNEVVTWVKQAVRYARRG